MEERVARILLAGLSKKPVAEKKDILAQASPEEWRTVLAFAKQHRVAALLHHRLKALGVKLPDDVADTLKQAYRKNSLRNFRLYNELGGLLSLLHTEEIEVIGLKGVHLAAHFYEHIGARRIGDIDLLARKQDLSRIDQIMQAHGCKSCEYHRIAAPENYHVHYMLPKSGLCVEIHWTISPPAYRAVIDIEEIWSRARHATLANVPVLVMSPEDLMLHLCLHVVHHAGEMGIRMLLDFEPIVRGSGASLNWGEISARARQWGISRAVYVVLRLAREMLDVPVPEDWLASLQPSEPEKHYAVLLQEEILAVHSVVREEFLGSAHLVQLWGRKRLREKLTVIRDRVLPSREKMATLYPVAANSWRVYLYYPVRVKDLLMRFGGAVWRLASGNARTRAAAVRANEINELRDWLMSV